MASADDTLCVLMNAYRNYELANNNPDQSNEKTDAKSNGSSLEQPIVDAYRKYSSSIRNSNSTMDDKVVLEEALKFCRQQKTESATFAAENEDRISPLVKITCDSPLFKAVLSDDTTKQNSYNLEAEKEVRELSIKDNGSPTPEIMMQAPTRFTHPVNRPPRGQITMVENQGKTYTRIGPPAMDPRQAFAPSRHSAFRPTMPLDGKRLRLDPGMQYLQVDACNKNRLSRSTSVPVYPEGEENTPPHRVLFRTGSFVSNLTKQKLKNSILARTSAALVRKPSITDHEMRQIRSKEVDDESDSSQSEDEDFEEEPVTARKRKFSDEKAPSSDRLIMMPPSLPTVITSAGPT